MLSRYRKRAHDDDKHEQVVDRQTLFDYIPSEKLAAELPPCPQAEHDAEPHRDDDIEHRPRNRLPKTNHVWPARRHTQVRHQERADQTDRQRPPSRRHLHHSILPPRPSLAPDPTPRTTAGDGPQRSDQGLAPSCPP